MNNQEWLQLINATGTAVSALLGFIGLIATAFIVSWLGRRQRQWEIEQERRNLASAFIGEISALYRIVNLRRYVTDLQQRLQILEESGEFHPLRLNVQQRYFGVFEANVGKIGLLPAPLPERISTLYVAMKSVLEDFANLDEGRVDGAGAAAQADVLRHLIDLLVGALALARVTCRELAEFAGTKPPQLLSDEDGVDAESE